MTELTSLGSQSSRLKMLHFLQVQLFRLEDAFEFAPVEAPPPPGGVGDSDSKRPSAPSRLRAEEALRLAMVAEEGSKAWSGDKSSLAKMDVRDCTTPPRCLLCSHFQNESIFLGSLLG